MKLSLSIVIPNYNGLALLKKHLPSVVEFSQGAKIIIVDDASGDNSVNWLAKHYPQVEVIKNSKNQGFALSVNAGFKQATTDLVLLLNNDVSINRSTIIKAIHHFENPKIFAVGCLEKLPSGKLRGKSSGSFKRGLMIHRKASVLRKGPTLWVFAASGFFKRDLWIKLGGLDDLYKPAYWEDIDVSYRAWKAGYECVFEPAATVKHEAEATMKKTLGTKKQAYAFKNQLLFFWKNVTDPWLIIKHFFWTPYHLVITTLKTKGAFLAGFLMALTQIDQILDQHQKLPFIKSDQEIVDKLTQA